ncbi:MAG: calcium/proton exchanger [Chthonomonadales bacterium]
MRWINLLLVFLPVSVALHFMHAGPVLVFLSACAAIVPLAGLIGSATEEIAKTVGDSAGGLLNATFGNAAELIITIMAVRAGEMELVRASIAGSIIGNILLVLGLSVFVGGIKHKRQYFDKAVASNHTVMMVLAVIALITPTLFVRALPGVSEFAPNVRSLSLWVSGLLIALYFGSLFYAFRTHEDLFRGGEEEEREPPEWSMKKAGSVLAAATVGIVFMSELLVNSVTPTIHSLGLNMMFVGVIVIPIIGNAAEHSTAVSMALKDKMDITFNICISSSTQIALFVAPLLVFLSLPLGHFMPFIFNPFEVTAIAFSVLIAAFIARDGQCDWLEGAQLLTVYFIFALAFYFIPK